MGKQQQQVVIDLPMPDKDDGFGEMKHGRLRVLVDYDKGDRRTRRGYSLIMSPEVYDDHMVRVMIPDPRYVKSFIEEAKMFSAKRLALLANEFSKKDSVLYTQHYLPLLEQTIKAGTVFADNVVVTETQPEAQAGA